MSTLIRRTWGTTKPPLGTPVDYSHPLARGLLWCFFFQEGASRWYRDVVQGAWLGQFFSPVARDGFWGPSLDFTSAIDRVNNFRGTAALVAPSVPCAMVAWVDGLASIPNGTALNGIGTVTGSPLWGPEITNGASGNLGILKNSVADINLGVPYPTQPAVCGWGLRSDNSAWAFNGTAFNTATNSSAPNAAGSAAIPIIGNASSGAGRLGGIAVYARDITPNEMRWLAEEPFAFMQPPGPKVLYYDLTTVGTTFNQSLSVTQTQTPSIVKSVGKIVNGSQTQTPTVVKSVGKNVSASQTQTASRGALQVGKLVNVTQTQTASQGPRTITKTILGANVQVPQIVKSVGHIMPLVTQVQTATIAAVKVVLSRGLAGLVSPFSKTGRNTPASKTGRVSPGEKKGGV